MRGRGGEAMTAEARAEERLADADAGWAALGVDVGGVASAEGAGASDACVDTHGGGASTPDTPRAEAGEGAGVARAPLPRRLAALVCENRRLIIVAACALVFIALLEDVLEGELVKLDAAAYWLVVERLRADWLTPVMESFSALATPLVLLVMLLAVAAFAPGRRPGLCCAVNLGLVVALNQLLKFVVQRPRPDGFRLAEASGYSFPSGHSMAAMAFFGLLIWFVWHYERDRRMRALLVTAFSLVIVMVGVSRIYLGVHYASDVVAGFCVSLIWLALYTRIAAPLSLREGEGAGAA